MKTASIGFRSKTGRAIAVAVAAGASEPAFVLRREVALWNPDISATFMPHHQVMELPWAEAQRAVRPAERAIEKIASAVLSELKRELKKQGFELDAVGVAGSPERSLEKIGNFHIRAHAAEGILFRRVIEIAAEKHKLTWYGFSDRDFLPTAGEKLKIPDKKVDEILKKMGRTAGSPWRQDERIAAVAGWLALRG